MCIAIFKPADAIVSPHRLETCFDNNPDGAGYMFCKGGRVEIRKPFFTFKAFAAAYDRDLAANPTSPFGIHFRIATHGDIDKRNAHPHRVSPSCAIIHNGIFDIKVPPKSPLSDTAIFVEGVLKQLPKRFEHYDGVVWLLEAFAGVGNKMVLLRGDGSHFILNEQCGHEDAGAWYSNRSYQWTTFASMSRGHGWAMAGGTGSSAATAAGGVLWDDDDPMYAATSSRAKRRRWQRYNKYGEPSGGVAKPHCVECECLLSSADVAKFGTICEQCFDVACYMADYELKNGRGSATGTMLQTTIDRATAYLVDGADREQFANDDAAMAALDAGEDGDGDREALPALDYDAGDDATSGPTLDSTN